MILSHNVSLSRDWREQLSEGRQCISKRHDSLQPFSAKSLPGAGMSLLWEGGLCAGRHFSVGCNFLGPRQIEALGGSVGAAWLRGFTFLPVPLHRARESGVREHLLQHFFSFLGSSREDEDGPPGAMMPWRQAELPIVLKIPVVLREHLPGAMSAKQENPPGNWGETVSRNERGQILHPGAELHSITRE